MPDAFIPWRKIETSVADIRELEENPIWLLGDDIGMETRRLPAIARGDFEANDVNASGLKIVIAPPKPRHWHILGWDANSRALQKEQARELADYCELHVR